MRVLRAEIGQMCTMENFLVASAGFGMGAGEYMRHSLLYWRRGDEVDAYMREQAKSMMAFTLGFLWNVPSLVVRSEEMLQRAQERYPVGYVFSPCFEEGNGFDEYDDLDPLPDLPHSPLL